MASPGEKWLKEQNSYSWVKVKTQKMSHGKTQAMPGAESWMTVWTQTVEKGFLRKGMPEALFLQDPGSMLVSTIQMLHNHL